jgi:hypothetical protein
MPKRDAPTVAPSIERSFKPPLTNLEHASLCDYLHYVVESLNDVICYEETYGNRAPILSVLREYAQGATALLDRLK